MVRLHFISNVTVRNVGKLGLLMYSVPTDLPQGTVLALANITVIGPDGKVVWNGCLAQTTSKYVIYPGYFCRLDISYTTGGAINIGIAKVDLGKAYRYPIVVHEGKYHIVINMLLVTGYAQHSLNVEYKITTVLKTPKLVTNIG